MKYLITTSLFLAIFFYSFSQNNSTEKSPVLLKSIEGKYEGKTKKGLAHGFAKAYGEKDSYEGEFKKGFPHGEGTYTWENGNKYTGSFIKGMMSGEGELVIKRNENLPDSILVGYFEDNEYVGKYQDPYRVSFSSGIRNIDFQKKDNLQNQIQFMFYANGQAFHPALSVLDVKNTVIRKVGGYDTMENVDFPLENVKISFSHGSFNYNFTFDLYEKGSWTVVVSF